MTFRYFADDSIYRILSETCNFYFGWGEINRETTWNTKHDKAPIKLWEWNVRNEQSLCKVLTIKFLFIIFCRES